MRCISAMSKPDGPLCLINSSAGAGGAAAPFSASAPAAKPDAGHKRRQGGKEIAACHGRLLSSRGFEFPIQSAALSRRAHENRNTGGTWRKCFATPCERGPERLWSRPEPDTESPANHATCGG